MKNIVLIGMPGSGKTTIGKILAEELDMKFCDSDEYIEEHSGKSIPEIFQDGEERFRSIEKEAILEISNEENTVIATGGGVVKSLENIINLKNNGVLIFINRPLEDIMSDIDANHRPLIKDEIEKLNKLFEERYSLYKKYSDYEVMNRGSLQELVTKIIKLLRP
ncbi:MAG TPA: shikimate kinase [Tissierellaceae bacterium]|nr:shikimate kinase [Tissierellaceae bacterium]